MHFETIENIRVLLPRAALVAIFDECDRFERDETGGRILGTYDNHNGRLTIHVTGIIEPGPGARRTPVSFYQDGEHQERVFRHSERDHPEIEHLGNWHTHHVNGLPTLSEGDITTYRRTVNHNNHNTTFFYALLVVEKRKGLMRHKRYAVKHYLLRRSDQRVYEIAPTAVELVREPLIWPSRQTEGTPHYDHASRTVLAVRPERAYDRDVLADCYQGLHPYTAQRLGFYWRGPLEFIDGSRVEVVILENASSLGTTYSVALRELPDVLKAVAADLAVREFSSATAALIMTERICNRLLYEQRYVSYDQKPAPLQE